MVYFSSVKLSNTWYFLKKLKKSNSSRIPSASVPYFIISETLALVGGPIKNKDPCQRTSIQYTDAKASEILSKIEDRSMIPNQ